LGHSLLWNQSRCVALLDKIQLDVVPAHLVL